MTDAALWLSANVPGRLESHPAHVVCVRPYCTVQELDPEDLQQTMCELIHDDEKRPLIRVDEDAFRLHMQFMHAHGVPKGEFTTFSNVGTLGSDAVHAGRPGSTR